MLTYQEFRPEPRAANAIKVIWSLTGSVDSSGTQPIVSDGNPELVFNAGDLFQQADSRGSLEFQPRAMLIGPTALPTFVKPGRSVQVVGVRLQPWATAVILGTSASELRDRIVPMDQISLRFRNIASMLLEEAARQDPSRFIELACAQLSRSEDPESLRPLIEAIRAAPETPSVGELARRFGRSVRSVQRNFARDVGMSPKTLLRIARVQRALGHAMQRPDHAWTRIAVHAGYYDQAHFVREFRELVGLLPSEFRPDPESLTTTFVGSA